MKKTPFDDLDALFEGKAWLALELAEKVGLSVDIVRQKMIILENSGLITHVREGRFNVYFTVKDREKYLNENPEERIRSKLRR